ncbi:MAG: hypothetical protein RIQ81_1666 [Pseudomonadota bacterium]
MLDLSVVIITLNEEARIGRCLESLPEGVEVIVLDSGSTDKTREVARSLGARVQERSFDDYSSQKNAALAFATRSWVLSLDADEVLTPPLCSALTAFVRSASADPEVSAFRLRRQLVFMGRVMRYGKTVDHPVRLMRRGAGAFASEIHETFKPLRGRTGDAGFSSDCVILHHSYDNLTDYFDKFNRYTTRMAASRKNPAASRSGLLVHVLRPHFEFVSRYFFRLGFLDGYPGYCYALLSSLYAFVKYAKANEP